MGTPGQKLCTSFISVLFLVFGIPLFVIQRVGVRRLEWISLIFICEKKERRKCFIYTLNTFLFTVV